MDELLWKHFYSQHGTNAEKKLQDYALTMLNNIQIMYYQPSAVPQLTFHVIRFEVLTSQPVRILIFSFLLSENLVLEKFIDFSLQLINFYLEFFLKTAAFTAGHLF